MKNYNNFEGAGYYSCYEEEEDVESEEEEEE